MVQLYLHGQRTERGEERLVLATSTTESPLENENYNHFFFLRNPCPTQNTALYCRIYRDVSTLLLLVIYQFLLHGR